MARPLKPEMVRYLSLFDELCAEDRDPTRPLTPVQPSMTWPPASSAPSPPAA
jgi:hypothetical protein